MYVSTHSINHESIFKCDKLILKLNETYFRIIIKDLNAIL